MRRGPRSRRSRASRPWVLPTVVLTIILGPALVHYFAQRTALLVTLVVGTAAVALTVVGGWIWLRVARFRRRQALTRGIDGVDALSGVEFEQFVATLMRRTGFVDVRVRGGAGDLGADVTALMPDGRLVVQCKRYQVDRKVGSADIQKLAGTARQLHDADVAALVTSGYFTRPATEVAARLGIALVDRDALARWATDDQPPEQLLRPPRPDVEPV